MKKPKVSTRTKSVTLNDKTLAELERLAKAATPGPWYAESRGKLRITTCPPEDVGAEKKTEVIVETPIYVAPTGSTFPDAQANARFIAAASPDTVLALIEQVREQERRLKIATEALEFAAETVHDQFCSAIHSPLCDKPRAALEKILRPSGSEKGEE